MLGVLHVFGLYLNPPKPNLKLLVFESLKTWLNLNGQVLILFESLPEPKPNTKPEAKLKPSET